MLNREGYGIQGEARSGDHLFKRSTGGAVLRRDGPGKRACALKKERWPLSALSQGGQGCKSSVPTRRANKRIV